MTRKSSPCSGTNRPMPPPAFLSSVSSSSRVFTSTCHSNSPFQTGDSGPRIAPLIGARLETAPAELRVTENFIGLPRLTLVRRAIGPRQTGFTGKDNRYPFIMALSESGISKMEAVRQAVMSLGKDAPLVDVLRFVKQNFKMEIPRSQAYTYKS